MSQQLPPRGSLEDLQERLDAMSRLVADLRGRIEDAEEENEQLRNQLDRVAALVDPDDLEVDEMSKQQKVARIREHLVERARSRGGKAALDYNAVVALFDGSFEPPYAYKLMSAAGKVEGFDYSTPSQGNKRVSVDLDRVKDATRFSPSE